MMPKTNVHMQECMHVFKVNEDKFDEIRKFIHTHITPILLEFGPLLGKKYELWLAKKVFPVLQTRFKRDFPKNCFSNPRCKHSMCIRRLLMLEKQYYRRKEKLTK